MRGGEDDKHDISNKKKLQVLDLGSMFRPFQNKFGPIMIFDSISLSELVGSLHESVEMKRWPREARFHWSFVSSDLVFDHRARLP